MTGISDKPRISGTRGISDTLGILDKPGISDKADISDKSGRRSLDQGVPRAILLFAHGARDPEWAEPFKAMRQLIIRQLPGVPVELAYLEFMQPTLAEAVAQLSERGIRIVTLAPLFMARGGHLKHDLPLLLDALRQSYPNVELELIPAIGDAPEVLEQIALWVIREHSQMS